MTNKNIRKKERMQAKPGGSNYGEYDSKDAPFAGPSGGAPSGTYPLGKGGKLDPKRVRAAIALAHNAPNPEGIKKKVMNVLDNKNRMPSLAASIRSKLKGGKK